MSPLLKPHPLPASLDAEKGVLCSVLLSPDCLGDLGDLTQKHFHHPAHGTIWQCFVEMRATGKPIDLVTVTQEIADRKQLEHIGGAHVLAELQRFIPTALNVSTYAETLKEKASARALIKTCEEAIQSAYEHQSQPVSDLVTEALSKLEPFAHAEKDRSLFHAFSKAAIPFTELVNLDIPPRRKIVGEWLCEGDMGIIFAPRGVGKTWFALGLATAITGRDSFGPWKICDRPRVLYLDGEMPVELIKERVKGMGGGDDSLVILNHQILFQQAEKEVNLADSQAQDEILQLCLQDGIGVLVCDNLSCLTYGLKENDNDSWEIMKRWFLKLRRHNITVLLVHHAGRNGDLRGGSKREDDTSWIISLQDAGDDSSSKQGAGFISIFTKQPRNVPNGEPAIEWSFTTGENGAVVISSKEPNRLEQLIQLVRDGVTLAGDLAQELKVGAPTVSKWAKKLMDQGLLVKKGREYALSS